MLIEGSAEYGGRDLMGSATAAGVLQGPPDRAVASVLEWLIPLVGNDDVKVEITLSGLKVKSHKMPKIRERIEARCPSISRPNTLECAPN